MSFYQRREILFIVGLLVVVAVLLAVWPHHVRGTVTNASGPVAGAVVRLRATDIWTTTGASGAFALPVRGLALHRTVTAWKEGYYTGAADLTGFGRNLFISLRPLTTEDHPHTDWLPSDADPAVELACANCHVDLHRQWRQSGHATAATNDLVRALYNGTDVQGVAGVGHGFRLDFPEEVGNCAACHAPGAAVDHPAGVDLNQVEGEAANGVFCQFCHAIDFAHSPYAETTTGVNALKLLRPASGQHLFIGPFDDVPGRDTFNPIYRQSRACAPCHSGGWWGVSAYASFDEWQASPYAAEGVQCQDCHMAPDGQTTRSVSPCAPESEPLHASRGESPTRPGPEAGTLWVPSPTRPYLAASEFVCRVRACVECHITPGAAGPEDPTTATALLPARDPATLSTHGMSGVDAGAFLRSAVAMTVTATQGSDGVLVEVAVTNVGAGHHVPTDSPLRNLILLVTAHDALGRPLAYIGDLVVPAWGGVGAVDGGNYAGQPGKGFAKVMEDYEGNAPAPPWRNGIRILSDNRIAARATDRSQYRFGLPTIDLSVAREKEAVTVTAQLLHRRIFKPWADEKGIALADAVMAKAMVTATPSNDAVLADQTRPIDGQLFAPSLASTVHGKRLDPATLATPEQCSACHTAISAAWQASGHARAATSPLYRARYKVATQDTHLNAGAFCAGCHTPIGLLSGQIRTRWTWAGQEEYPLDAAAQTGVACAVCHAIVDLTGIRNGAYVIDPVAISQSDHVGLNIPGISEDSGNVGQPLLTQPEFCAACHEAVNPTTDLPVMTTYSEWRASRFNTGDVTTTTTCQDCHFAAGRHGALLPEDLARAAQVEILTPLQRTEDVLNLPVRVTNTGAGHDLPTGATELQQIWLAVTVIDSTGRLILSSGEVDDYGDPVQGSVTYGTTWRDVEGKPTERLWEAASVLRDRRIPAGAAVIETFSMDLPSDVVGPLHVRATLKYRAVSGYLGSLMSIYVQEEAPPAPEIDMATVEKMIPLVQAMPGR